MNIFSADYKNEYEDFAMSVSYPQDRDEIDVDRLFRVLEYFAKIHKIESIKKTDEVSSSPQRSVNLWFEKIVGVMMRQKLDFYIFSDYDQYDYGLIGRNELE